MALCTISDDNIRRIRAEPALLSRALGLDDGDWTPPRRPGFLARLFGARDEPARPPASVGDAGFGEVEHSDVDKAWHGLHYLLTGTAGEGEPPLNALLAGGEQVDCEDLESGARLFTAARVRALHAALAPIDHEVLRQRYDPPAMAVLDLYPQIRDRDDQREANFDYLRHHFEALKEFVARAQQQGLGLVVYFT